MILKLRKTESKLETTGQKSLKKQHMIDRPLRVSCIALHHMEVILY